MKSMWKYGMLIIALLMLGGCDSSNSTDSTDSTDSTETSTYTLTALDGYLDSAEVYVDLNGDGVGDDDELEGTTDSNGQITLDDDTADYAIIVRAVAGTTTDSDYDTVLSDNYELIATAGATTVNPFTTLAYLYNTTVSDLVTELDPDGTLGLDEATLSGDYAGMSTDAAIVAEVLARSVTLLLDETVTDNYEDDGSSVTTLDLYVDAIVDQLEDEVSSISDTSTISDLEDDVIALETDSDGDVVSVSATTTTELTTDTDSSSSNYAINDTGITTCSDESGTTTTCTDTEEDTYGQDGAYGRDVNSALNSDANGSAGFNFTKISSSGEELDADATDWNCVQDNITGLMWEVKTDESDDLRFKDGMYTWYNSNNSILGLDYTTPVYNGGNVGTETTNTENCYFGSSGCDTEKYVADVNDAGLCDYSDWRLPTKEELRSIVDYSSDAYTGGEGSLDSDYFPNTQTGSSYWSASPAASNGSYAWLVDFNLGYDGTYVKSAGFYVRLVRAGQ